VHHTHCRNKASFVTAAGTFPSSTGRRSSARHANATPRRVTTTGDSSD